jgi:hypothetical protein
MLHYAYSSSMYVSISAIYSNVSLSLSTHYKSVSWTYQEEVQSSPNHQLDYQDGTGRVSSIRWITRKMCSTFLLTKQSTGHARIDRPSVSWTTRMPLDMKRPSVGLPGRGEVITQASAGLSGCFWTCIVRQLDYQGNVQYIFLLAA